MSRCLERMTWWLEPKFARRGRLRRTGSCKKLRDEMNGIRPQNSELPSCDKNLGTWKGGSWSVAEKSVAKNANLRFRSAKFEGFAIGCYNFREFGKHRCIATSFVVLSCLQSCSAIHVIMGQGNPKWPDSSAG